MDLYYADDRLSVRWLALDEVFRGEKMLSSWTGPESYVTEYTLVNEDNAQSQSDTFIPGQVHPQLPEKELSWYQGATKRPISW